MSRSRSMPLAMACDVDALFCVSLRSLFLKLEIRSDYPYPGTNTLLLFVPKTWKPCYETL